MSPAVLNWHQHWSDPCSVCRAGGFSCFRRLPAPDTGELFTRRARPTPAPLQPDQRQNWLGHLGEVACHKQAMNTQSPLVLRCCYLFYCHICWFLVTAPGLLCNTSQDESHLVHLLSQGCDFLGYTNTSPGTVLPSSKIFTFHWALPV